MRTFCQFLVLALLAAPALWGSPSVNAQAAKKKGHFTIGKETTYVTGPIDKNGYIDYPAALNKLMSEGVTPQNNAVVLLWQAHGPRPEGNPVPAEFFRQLGIEVPADNGDYFVSMYPFLQDRLKLKIAWKDFDSMSDLVGARPWTAKEQKHLAAWLQANEKPLALVAQAAQRTHYFHPLLSGKSPEDGPGLMLSALEGALPGLQKCRQFAHALRARAMLRLGEGDHDGAWQDMLTCQRLARQISRGGTLIENLVGIAIDAVATDAYPIYLDHAKPDARKLATCLSDLRSLPPMREAAEAVGQAERFTFLDCVLAMDRHGPRFVDAISGKGAPKNPKSNPAAERFMNGIDLDPALRNANDWFTRLMAAMRTKERAARKIEFDKIMTDAKALKVKVGGPNGVASILGFANAMTNPNDLAKPDKAAIEQILQQSDKARGKLLGEVMIVLVLPAVGKVQEASERSRQRQDNVLVALALARYQRDQGRYPDKLDALAPKYLPAIPQDWFAGKPLVYRLTDKGYLLYSVGSNGKDEGGRSYDDDPPGDDLRVRMPPELRKM